MDVAQREKFLHLLTIGVERVAFQTEHLGWKTDDLLITRARSLILARM
jgi:hypothetical protein